MINELNFKKAIEKAVKGGYDFKKGIAIINHIDLIKARNIVYSGGDISIVRAMYSIIFSHDFAKAFWGEEEQGTTYKGDIVEWENWQRHLAQMVLEKEPLKYIEKFL